MIFLIGKIFIYILLAGVVGAVAGWLFRNMQAQRTEEHAQRAANDAKAKLPQLESLLRGRDEQITKLKEMLAEKKEELSEQVQNMRELEIKLRDQEREAKRWQQSAEARQGTSLDEYDLGTDGGGDDANGLIAELSQEITRLKAELASATAEAVLNDAAGQASASNDAEVAQLRAQLQQTEKALEAAKADLAHEQNKVLELERERELQNRSLQVLHQQLDLERTRRAANG